MQNSTTYYNFLSFVYREDLKILFLRWLEKVNSEQLRAGYEEAFHKATEFNVCFWLLDLRGRGPISKEDEAWVVNNFFPKVEANLQITNYYAYLVAPGHQEHFQLNCKADYLKNISSRSEFSVFTAENDAIEWLLKAQK